MRPRILLAEDDDEVRCSWVAVSAFGGEAMRVRAHTLGAVAFFDKPVAVHALERTLHEAVDGPTVSPA